MAAGDAGGGMSNARRRRERRLRSWWRHEAQSVAAALTGARHHSTGPREEVVTRREKRQEGEVHEENDGLRAQTTPLPGVRPAPLSEVARPEAAVTVGYVAAGPPSLVVALVAVHDHVDQASVQFLLQQYFLARVAEEEKAREEVKMLEDDVADKESLLLEELCKVRDGVGPPWSKFSGIEKAAEEGKQEGKKEEEDEAAENLLLTASTSSSHCSHMEIWTYSLWFFLVFGIWDYWIIG